MRPILIPPKKRIYIHRGQWRLDDVNYQSFHDHYNDEFVKAWRSEATRREQQHASCVT
jgi:hypothetical protein